MKLNTYIGKFTVIRAEACTDNTKVKLTGHNKRNSHRYKHQATDQAAKRIETDAQIKVRRLNDRRVQRLDSKLSKGKISLADYKAKLAEL